MKAYCFKLSGDGGDKLGMGDRRVVLTAELLPIGGPEGEEEADPET